MTTYDDGIRPGWHLYVECYVCGDAAEFDGFVMTQAAGRASAVGWSVDTEQLYVRADERQDACPKHSKPT